MEQIIERLKYEERECCGVPASITKNQIVLDVSDEEASAFAAALRGNRHTRYLRLDLVRFSDEGMRILADALPETGITRLVISDSPVSPEGAAHLGEMLAKSPVLEQFVLWLAGCADAGAVSIADGIAKSPCLKTIGFSDYRLRDVGALAIAKAVEKSRHVDNAFYPRYMDLSPFVYRRIDHSRVRADQNRRMLALASALALSPSSPLARFLRRDGDFSLEHRVCAFLLT
jgi:hypothetical protein